MSAEAAIPRPPWLHLEVVPVSPVWRDRVQASTATMLIGYSTGAFLALSEPTLLERFDRVVLLAPFIDFKAEAELGGRVQTAQLKFLLRQLKRDPLGSLHDFYDRAGIAAAKPTELPQSLDDLCWGIERLLHDHADSAGLSRAECYVGADDQLLDAGLLATLYPTVKVVPGSGHDLGGLVAKVGALL